MCVFTVLLAIIVNLLWTLFVIISALTVCQPIAYNWNLTIPGGHCNNKVKLNTYIANAVWTILYDTTLWSLPQIIVWRLHMSKAARAGLSLIFALGILYVASFPNFPLFKILDILIETPTICVWSKPRIRD